MGLQQNRALTDAPGQSVTFRIYATGEKLLIQNEVPIEGDDCRIFSPQSLNETTQPLRLLGSLIRLVKPHADFGQEVFVCLFQIRPFEIAFCGTAGVKKI
jgi:hypothetical protein